ncbi:MAG: hypothetical protein Hyperionvirus3_173 [Hyperionvirus sp.]|uniref:Uncharacterized protein n=1 Tax=Hyperionvirus sp. TaxID=2487770 RepID=A0A3G5A710_9VIRU|nr:MAG: hypothetical protein Hyperionvirus3_173 [Hyperionvirus sp.]
MAFRAPPFSRRPCRNGKGCSRPNCWFFHPITSAADICSKGLGCLGECKLIHVGRRDSTCRYGVTCMFIGTCLFWHPSPTAAPAGAAGAPAGMVPPCNYSFLCLRKKTCAAKHETKDEYYNRLRKIRPFHAFNSVFTRNSLNEEIVDDHKKAPHKCDCPRCDQKIAGTNPYCSDQCGGFFPKWPQKSSINGHGTANPGGCYHEHSRCNIPKCKQKCDTCVVAPNHIANPFCKYHAPKCDCGIPTFSNASCPRVIDPTDVEVARMMHSYNEKCLRCYRIP